MSWRWWGGIGVELRNITCTQKVKNYHRSCSRFHEPPHRFLSANPLKRNSWKCFTSFRSRFLFAAVVVAAAFHRVPKCATNAAYGKSIDTDTRQQQHKHTRTETRGTSRAVSSNTARPQIKQAKPTHKNHTPSTKVLTLVTR